MSFTNDAPARIFVRSARSDDPDDAAFLSDLSHRLTTGAPSWHDPADIAASARHTLLEALHRHIANETILIAEDARQSRLGFLYALAATDPFSGEQHGHISDVVVAPVAEGSGVGRALMLGAEAWAADRGFQSLTLHVFPANTRAHAMYERLGYEPNMLQLRKSLT